MLKWYNEGKNADPPWLSENGEIDYRSLFIMSIVFVLVYRTIAGLMIYSLTKSWLRVLCQIIFDLEIYRFSICYSVCTSFSVSNWNDFD